MVTDILNKLDDVDENVFGKYQEEAIVSLALDLPEFFSSVGRFITPSMFSRVETQYIMANILNEIEKNGTIPTRKLFKDHIEKTITEDEPFEEVLRIIDRKSNPREVPMIKDTLIKWAKSKAYGMVYSEEVQDAYYRGDYSQLEAIIDEAHKIADVGDNGFWFFEEAEFLFGEDAIEHRTTGFAKLDKMLNNGGPSPGEVVCWMAPTNVGKSILLVNNAISSLKGMNGDGDTGQDVLLVTFELDKIKTGMRCLGSLAGVDTNNINDHEEYARRVVKQTGASYKKKLCIYELPPDECSVDHIYAVVDNLKRSKGWKPDVIILDYLELMVSRVKDYNREEYTRQKHVATEVRGLAKNEGVLVFTATQTNRSGQGTEELIDLNKSAESYGKNMPLDYVVSLNQTDQERQAEPPRLRFFVAKNRNGPKHGTISCEIDYSKMQVREQH
jgi:replicative DNA helicase